MPNEIENAFAALSDDAGHARLASAATLRKRADRQTLTRSLTGAAMVVVLVAGVFVGSRFVLADDALPPLPPAESTSPTTAPPSALPSPSATVKPSTPTAGSDTPSQPPKLKTTAPVIPGSIPNRAFLTSSDTNGGNRQRLGTPSRPLKLCEGAEDFASENLVGVRATVELLYEDSEPGTTRTPLAVVSDTVTIYRGDGAQDFMDEYREMVRDCPKGENGATYSSLGSLGLGDESVLVQGWTPARGDDGELTNNGKRNYTYYGVVRIGDSIVDVGNSGYESQSVDRRNAEALIRAAVRHVESWRS